jgi:HD-GYP domain-containing protein (c-di-GMP phosphodiesterase class II)
VQQGNDERRWDKPRGPARAHNQEKANVLKRITVDQLIPGMYIHQLMGSWLDNPFWRNSFLLKSGDEIERIRAAQIEEAMIDVSKGLDVPASAASTPEAAPLPGPINRQPREGRLQDIKTARPGDGNEQQRAKALFKAAKGQVTALFNEARMGRAIDANACLPLVDDISASVTRDPGAFISLARLKRQDEYTYMHSVAVCALMVGLARQLGLDEAQTRRAGLAGMMHDVGKALVPLDLLNKPGKLTPEEFRTVASHPVRGHELLMVGSEVDELVADVCLHHHEKFDGTGYPHGLKGDAISLFARMGAVCDVYDAVTSDRPYKKAWDPAESMRQMAQWKGHFDPAVFQAFIKTLGIYPIGSLVRLKSDRLAVVCSKGALLTPKVKVFFSIRSNMRIVPQELDLSSSLCSDKIVGVENPLVWKFEGLDNLWLDAA